MAYITTQEVAKIRAALKDAFPDFKFGVRREHGTSVYVSILSGPIDFSDIEHHDINPYWYDTHHRPQHVDIFSAIFKIIKHAGKEYFNESDLQIDYHHVAFYYNLSVGKYNKPYERKIPKKFKGNTDWAEAAETALAFSKLAA